MKVVPQLICLCLMLSASADSITAGGPFGPVDSGDAVPQERLQPEKPSPGDSREFQKRLELDGLPNAIRVHPDVISGGQPEGEAAYSSLRALGIRTIVSVDGVPPDREAALENGLRIIHLPHGYDGISPERRRHLAHAFLTVPRPIYIHCHHGRHRSPAAAATGSVLAGLITPQQGLDVLRLAGTSEDYAGLWSCVRQAVPGDEQQLASLEVQFRESVAPPPLVDCMARLEHLVERLEQLAEHNWRVDSDDPEESAVHAALLLREEFTEMERLESVQAQAAGFRQQLDASRQQSALLEALLKQDPERDAAIEAAGEQTARRRSAVVNQIRQGCRDCHRRYRD